MPKDNSKKKKGKKKVVFALLLIISVFAMFFLFYRIYMRLTTPSSYMIEKDNYIDYQKHYECSGYASAYALRSMGVDVTGLELYDRFVDKNPDGTLAPGYLWENLQDMGYKCSLRFGNMTDLKYSVTSGTPVIVLIRLNTYQPYLHYVPVIGYDDEYIYVVDSLEYMENVEDEIYNRKIPIDEFEELWKNDTFMFNNIYIKFKK